ncbi:glutenin, high molecular weight subunit, putative [Cyanobium sp. PCC 7001]|nr:glutenin, high molecular weight subunit, putative [Cyanobium sp. PCC 7001]
MSPQGRLHARGPVQAVLMPPGVGREDGAARQGTCQQRGHQQQHPGRAAPPDAHQAPESASHQHLGAQQARQQVAGHLGVSAAGGQVAGLQHQQIEQQQQHQQRPSRRRRSPRQDQSASPRQGQHHRECRSGPPRRRLPTQIHEGGAPVQPPQPGIRRGRRHHPQPGGVAQKRLQPHPQNPQPGQECHQGDRHGGAPAAPVAGGLARQQTMEAMAEGNQHEDQAGVQARHEGEHIAPERQRARAPSEAQQARTGQGRKQHQKAVGPGLLGIEKLQRRHDGHAGRQGSKAKGSRYFPSEPVHRRHEQHTEQGREQTHRDHGLAESFPHQPGQQEVERRVLGMARQFPQGRTPAMVGGESQELLQLTGRELGWRLQRREAGGAQRGVHLVVGEPLVPGVVKAECRRRHHQHQEAPAGPGTPGAQPGSQSRLTIPSHQPLPHSPQPAFS